MRIFYCVLIFISLTAEARILGESIAVNPYALPGDSDAVNLAVPGVQLHEFNDYFGKTDKLISGGGKLAAMQSWRHFSGSIGLRGRFIQPILKTRNDQPILTEKIGVYAETMESFLNLAYTFYNRNSLGWKFNLGAAYTDAGNHGLVNVYRKVHEVVASPVNDEKFGDKLHENFRSFYYGAGVIFPVFKIVNLYIGGSVYNSRPFVEQAYEASIVSSYSRWLAFNLKYQFIDQKRSDWWTIRSHRHQFLAGLRISQIWTPSLMYVSPWVKGDNYGQWYLSPISFTWPF